jgi:hypothetical protein
MASVAYFQTAVALSNFEELWWELFKPVVNTTKMAQTSELSILLLDHIEHQVPVAPSLTIEMARAAYFQTAVAPSNIEELWWELFKPVANTTKMAQTSELSILLLDYIEHQVPVAPSLAIEMACIAYFQTAVALSNVEELWCELFKPVANTTKMACRSELSILLLDYVEHLACIQPPPTVEMGCVIVGLSGFVLILVLFLHAC